MCVTVVAGGFLLSCRQSESRAESAAPPPVEIKAAVFPAQSSTITAQIEGQVRSVAVREGAIVAADTAIVELTNAVVERDAAVARAQLDWITVRESRRSRPAAASAGRPQDRLEVAGRILALKQARLERMRELRQTNDVTAREVELAEVEYLAAMRDFNDEQRVATGAAAPAAPPDDRELLRIERQKTAAEERFAAQRLALLRIVTPIAGTVTRMYVNPGQAVFPRDPIAEVSDVANLHVRGTVAPELLRYLKPGTRVDVRIFSVPPRAFSDEIEYIIPAQAGDARGAMVVVTIPNPDRSLQPNTEASITLRATE